MLRYSCLVLTLCAAFAACDSDSNDAAGSGGGGAASAGAGAAGETTAGGTDPGSAGEPSSAGAGGAPPSTECQPGYICFALDGEPLSRPGGGYRLMHQTEGPYSFVKYEMGLAQLSIEIYALEPGTYDVKDVAASGSARVAYYTFEGQDQVVYQGRSGSVTVSQYTDDFKITGTFEATLEKVVDDQYTGDELPVTGGSFSDVVLQPG